MSPRIREILPDTPAEQLFLLGGEDMRPFYFQPGKDPEHDRKFPVAYLADSAAIDEMSFQRQFPLPTAEIFSRRDRVAARVRANIKDARRIEAERQHLTHEFRKMVMRQTVDVQV